MLYDLVSSLISTK